MEVETTGSALIMSALDALINFSGLLVGPLIRAFSYRKVSLAGALLCSIGLSATSPAKNMGHILLSYSIINGQYDFILKILQLIILTLLTCLRRSQINFESVLE